MLPSTASHFPIMICFPVDFQDFHVLVLVLRDEQTHSTGVGYIRDRALHCYCCFILLTQPGKQPTLALSMQALRLQRDPGASAHTSAADKGSHGERGDGVKMLICDKRQGKLVPPAARVISTVFGLTCYLKCTKEQPVVHRRHLEWRMDLREKR